MFESMLPCSPLIADVAAPVPVGEAQRFGPPHRTLAKFAKFAKRRLGPFQDISSGPRTKRTNVAAPDLEQTEIQEADALARPSVARQSRRASNA